MKTRLPWGETELEVESPAHWRIIAEAQPKDFLACASVEEKVHRAMSSPQELIRRAAKLAPRGARVAIFPRGGVTFPILPSPAVQAANP